MAVCMNQERVQQINPSFVLISMSKNNLSPSASYFPNPLVTILRMTDINKKLSKCKFNRHNINDVKENLQS